MGVFADVGQSAARRIQAERVAAQARRLREDSRFYAEMAYCAPRGIPHSQFLEWEGGDRDKALAWQVVTAARCGGCGTFADEWVDPATGRTVAEQPYVAEAFLCHGCAEREGFAAEVRKAGGDLDGVTVRLRPFDPMRDDEED